MGVPISTPTIPLVAIINPPGDTIVFQSIENGRLMLYAHDLTTSRNIALHSGPTDGTDWFAPVLQRDGRRVLALDRDSLDLPRQWLLLADTDGSALRRFAFREEGYREATISGNGKVIFAVTGWNSVVRINAETEEVREIIPASPFITGITGAARPGAENRITGGRFASALTIPPVFPTFDIGGFQIQLDGRPMPLLSVSPTEAVYQIPWDFPTRFSFLHPATVQLPGAAGSPFEGPAITIGLLGDPRIEPKLIREDGTAVTAQTPIQSGEVLDAYVTGWRVAGQTTGVPAPSWPEPLSEPVTCEFSRYATFTGVLAWDAADVLWFRPAPLRAGVFQVRVRVPETIPGKMLIRGSAGTALRCTHPSGRVELAIE